MPSIEWKPLTQEDVIWKAFCDLLRKEGVPQHVVNRAERERRIDLAWVQQELPVEPVEMDERDMFDDLL